MFEDTVTNQLTYLLIFLFYVTLFITILMVVPVVLVQGLKSIVGLSFVWVLFGNLK